MYSRYIKWKQIKKINSISVKDIKIYKKEIKERKFIQDVKVSMNMKRLPKEIKEEIINNCSYYTDSIEKKKSLRSSKHKDKVLELQIPPEV